MNMSSLPSYPDSLASRPEDAIGKKDWSLLLTHLSLVTAASVFIAIVLFVLAMVVSAGQVTLLFERLW